MSGVYPNKITFPAFTEIPRKLCS